LLIYCIYTTTLCVVEQEMNAKKVSLALLVVLVVQLCAGHPTYYPHRAATKKQTRSGSTVLPSPPPPIISYHVHVTYTVFNPDVITRAMALRQVAHDAFQPFLGPDCDGRYDYGYLCFIIDHDFNTTLIGGPFVSGEWSIFVPVHYHGLVVPWMMQNRGEFSIIVHPNTGYEYEDHSIWSMWAGQVWPLDMTIFEQGNQTNEFGHYPGDSDNPVCLDKGGVCGDSFFGLGPNVYCCGGLACNPAESFGLLQQDQIYRCS